jgi:hypothetical protein
MYRHPPHFLVGRNSGCWMNFLEQIEREYIGILMRYIGQKPHSCMQPQFSEKVGR